MISQDQEGLKLWIPRQCSKPWKQIHRVALGEYQVSAASHSSVWIVTFITLAKVSGSAKLCLTSPKYCKAFNSPSYLCVTTNFKEHDTSGYQIKNVHKGNLNSNMKLRKRIFGYCNGYVLYNWLLFHYLFTYKIQWDFLAESQPPVSQHYHFSYSNYLCITYTHVKKNW